MRFLCRHKLYNLWWMMPVSVVLAVSVAWFNVAGRLTFGWFVRCLVTWLVLAAAIWIIDARSARRFVIAAALLAVPMSVARVYGAHFMPYRHPPFTPLVHRGVELMIDWLACAVVTLAALCLLVKGAGQPERVDDESHVRGWPVVIVMLAAAVMLLAWSPYFIVFRPGIVVRDSWSSIRPWLGMTTLTNHHPVLFSAWVGACIRISAWLGHGMRGAVALFSVWQAIMMAIGLGLVVGWMWHRFGRWSAIAVATFFAFDPHLAMWSITMHKDTMFVIVMTLMCVLLAEYIWRPVDWITSWSFLVRFLVLGLLVAFTRNNGPYIVAGLVVILALGVSGKLFRVRHHGWKWWRVPTVGALCLATIVGIQGPGYRAWGIPESEYVESAGIPIQQVAWSVRYGTVSPNQAKTITQMMPLNRMRKMYAPTLVDSLKFDHQFDGDWVSNHRSEFRALWLDLARSNMRGYLLSWFALDGRYLDPGALYLRVDPGTIRGRGNVPISGKQTVGDDAELRERRMRLTKKVEQFEQAPAVNLAYRTSLQFWCCVVALVSTLLTRRPRGALVFLPPVLAIGSLLVAAPMTDFRYAACLHVALPVLLAVAAALAHPSMARHVR